MTKTIERQSGYGYDEATKQRALIELAACSGNTRMASRNLAQEDLEIEHTVLYSWMKKTHAADYIRIRREQMPRIQAVVAEESLQLARASMDTERKLLAELHAESHLLEPRDRINAIGKLAIDGGIHIDKHLVASGQATSIVEHRTSAEIMRELKAQGVDQIDAEVLSEEDLTQHADDPPKPSGSIT
jgi:hypothetical protein